MSGKTYSNIQWKQWVSTQRIFPKMTNTVIFKIVTTQHFLAVSAWTYWILSHSWFKYLITLFLGTKAKTANIRKSNAYFSSNSISPYISWSPVDWKHLQMFDGKWKKQPFISTWGNSNWILFIAARWKSKRIQSGIPRTGFEIPLENNWYVC